MDQPDSTRDEQALLLREEALEICARSGWHPRRIGQGQYKIGFSEIYEELRCLQKVLAVHISQDLIDCCRRHQIFSPYFDDVEARIWLFQNDRKRAQERWYSLLDHANEQVRSVANEALTRLDQKIKSGEQVVIEVSHALDRGEQQRMQAMLNQALIEAEDLDDSKLLSLLDMVAMQRPMPSEFPINRDLYINQLMFELFDQQLQGWESLINAES